MHDEIAIEAIQAASVRVFLTMLGMELVCETPQVAAPDSARREGVVAQISLVGACSITSLVGCSSEVACAIAAAMLLQQCPTVDDEVLDAMAEIANMIMGTVKTELDTQLGQVNLSIPTVTYGSGFMVHNHSKRWMLLPFRMEAGELYVKVCFEPAAEPRKQHGATHAVACDS